MTEYNNRDTPPPIQYGRSPSPIQKVIYTYSDDEIQSPQRKTRTVKRNTQLQSGSTGEKRGVVSADVSTGLGQKLVDELLSGTTEVTEEQLEGDPKSADQSVLLTLSDVTPYQLFLDSLQWDDTMITSVTASNKIFVVHGWNIKKHEPTVSMCVWIIESNTHVLHSQLIITLVELALEPMYQLCANAPPGKSVTHVFTSSTFATMETRDSQ